MSQKVNLIELLLNRKANFWEIRPSLSAQPGVFQSLAGCMWNEGAVCLLAGMLQ